MKANVIEVTRRGNSSRIANQLRKLEVSQEVTIMVSQNAPESMKLTGSTPAKKGWVEVDRNLSIEGACIKYNAKRIWIKTATLSGARRMWVNIN